MSKVKLTILSFLVALLISCSGEDTSKPQYTTQEGVDQIISDLNDEFGEGCAFTNLNMVFSDYGTMIVATGSNDFTDDKLVSKTRAMGSWTDTEEVTLTIEGDATMRDFMFSPEEMNIKNLANVTQDAVKRVSEKHAKMNTEFIAESVFINADDEIKEDGLRIIFMVDVEPKNGGTSFSCEYHSDGTFIRMDD